MSFKSDRALVMFDGRPGEGVSITLRRAAPHEPAKVLELRLLDESVDRSVDGQIETAAIWWSPASLTIIVGTDAKRTEFTQSVSASPDNGYNVVSPELATILAHAQADIYKPLTGAAFTRAARDGSMTLRPRPNPPIHTSFPLPPPETSQRP